MTEADINALPPIVSVSKGTGVKLAQASQQHATIAIWLPYYSSFDFNVLLLWVMAVGTFLAAGLWAGSDSLGSEHSYLKADDQQVKSVMPLCSLGYIVITSNGQSAVAAAISIEALSFVDVSRLWTRLYDLRDMH